MEIQHLDRGITKPEIRDLVGRDDPTILEIGAHHGGDSAGFLHEFKNIKLHCFEPDPRSASIHRSWISDTRCLLHEAAIGRTSGKTILYQSSGHPDPASKNVWDDSSSIRKPTDQIFQAFTWLKFDQTVEVNVLSLDDAIAGIGGINIVDFIWADIQGAEVDLIEGGRVTLVEKTRYLFTEFCDQEWYEGELPLEGILKLLPEFEPLAVYAGNDVLLRNRRLYQSP